MVAICLPFSVSSMNSIRYWSFTLTNEIPFLGICHSPVPLTYPQQVDFYSSPASRFSCFKAIKL